MLSCSVRKKHIECPNVGGVYEGEGRYTVSKRMRGQWSNDDCRASSESGTPPLTPPPLLLSFYRCSFPLSVMNVAVRCLASVGLTGESSHSSCPADMAEPQSFVFGYIFLIVPGLFHQKAMLQRLVISSLFYFSFTYCTLFLFSRPFSFLPVL